MAEKANKPFTDEELRETLGNYMRGQAIRQGSEPFVMLDDKIVPANKVIEHPWSSEGWPITAGMISLVGFIKEHMLALHRDETRDDTMRTMIDMLAAKACGGELMDGKPRAQHIDEMVAVLRERTEKMWSIATPDIVRMMKMAKEADGKMGHDA